MFTGLVECTGRVETAIAAGPGLRISIDAGPVARDAGLGASICVSGCCLSVVAIDGSRLTFELGPETLARTTLGRLAPGESVNLESSLRLSDRLGGHLVTGHVDAVGRLVSQDVTGAWVECRFEVPAPLLPQVASKGSVAVDGVSLTVCGVDAGGFGVALIPHTLAVTTLGRLRIGDPVNIETDLVAKYTARWLEARS